MKCLECEDNSDRLHPDPSTPPLSRDNCLCDICWASHARDEIESLQDVVGDLLDYRATNILKCPKCSSDDLGYLGHRSDRAGEVESWKCMQCRHYFDV